MGLSSEELDLIEKYVDDSLGQNEKDFFDKKYRENEEFKAEANFQLQLVDSFKYSELDEQNQKLRKDYKEFIRSKKTHDSIPIRSLIQIGIAASILLITTFSIVNFYSNGDELFDQYYSPYSGPSIQRGKGNLETMIEGLEYYESKNYESALEVFINLPEQDNQYRGETHILIGICYLELAQLEKSHSHFKQAMDLDSNYLGEWYLNMVLLKENKKEEVLENMKKIAESSSPFKEKAKELYNELSLNLTK